MTVEYCKHGDGRDESYSNSADDDEENEND